MQENSGSDNIWLHLLLIIPIEFGLLHATPLGPLITGWFTDLFAGLGFEFAQAASHGVAEAGAEVASSCGIDGCTLHGTFENAALDTSSGYVPAPEADAETLDL